METLVRSMGLLARLYVSAEDFLARNQAEPCDCIVCDIRMGAMSGLSLLSHIRKSGCVAPFIVVTAHALPHHLSDAALAGALCVLEKPVDPE
ncbi:conserved hypothetical protein, partial [Ricinus communis]